MYTEIEITAKSGTKVGFRGGLLWIENDKGQKTIALTKPEMVKLCNTIVGWVKEEMQK